MLRATIWALRRWARVNAARLALGVAVVTAVSGAALTAGMVPLPGSPSLPLLPPVAPAGSVQAGTAAGWLPPAPRASFPCSRSLMVRYNPTGAPVEATPDLRSAVNALGSAMGRAVVYAGQTAALSAQRFRGGPGPTILVRWVPSSGDLPGSATADSVATGTAVAADGMLIEGEVHLAASAAPPPGPGPAGLELVLRHELAHAVGITAHSTDPNDVLYRTIQLAKAASWGPGDLRALAGVGCSSAP